MNQNDMDRYYWRTGQQWSGDSRSLCRPVHRMRLSPFSKIALVIGTLLLFFATLRG